MNDFINRLLMHLFGMRNFRNQIIWNYSNSGFKVKLKVFHRNNDTLLHYTKSSNYCFNYITEKYDFTKKYIKRKFNSQTKKADVVKDKEGKTVYVEKEFKLIDCLWQIPMLNTDKECLGYPTQTQEALLERIILISTN